MFPKSSATNRRGLCVLAVSLLLTIAPKAHAQWGGFGYGGFEGFGGWTGLSGWGSWTGATGFGGLGGWGGGYGFGGMGFGNPLRYQMMDAQINESYAAANMFQQQAFNTALQNQMLQNQLAQDRFNLYTQQRNAAIARAREALPRIPFDVLFDKQGNVNWPPYAPAGTQYGDLRQQANTAIARVFMQYTQTGAAGTASVAEAKRKLQLYGQPALRLLRMRNQEQDRADLVFFLNGLEGAIERMGLPPAQPAADDGAANTPAPPKPGD